MRFVALMGGVLGAMTLSQFPEFSQQYLQRLAGQADALNAILTAFDASAAKAGLSREKALEELSGTTFRDAHRADMRDAILRAERVDRDLTFLRAADPLERLLLPHRFRDGETLAATWADFRPALPVTPEGLISGGIGFGAGWTLLAGLGALLRRPFRRSRV